ncbi:MAG TPA: thiamine phosphate synthase [Polyangia bacterium]
MRAIAGFYAIADLAPDAAPAAAATLAQDLLAGGAGVLQVRMKGAPAGRLLACVRAVAPGCAAAGALLVVNDRLDVALAAGTGGVQLGQDDLPLADARRLAPALVIGVSTHDLAQARAAAAGGADYIGYGPVFPTATKARPDPVVGLAGLARACAAVPVPVVAIGGITLAQVPAVLAAGAAAVAVIGAVVRSGDVRGAAAAVAAACRRT